MYLVIINLILGLELISYVRLRNLQVVSLLSFKGSNLAKNILKKVALDRSWNKNYAATLNVCLLIYYACLSALSA